MKMPTQKTEAVNDLTRTSFLIYGPPKIGKSTLAASFPKALFLPFEPGLDHLDHYQLPAEGGILETWEQFQEACALIHTGKHDFQTIVIDTVDLCYAACADYICKKRHVEYAGDMDHGKGWSLISTEFMRVIRKLAALPYGLVLISHAKGMTIKSKGGAEYERFAPTLSGGAHKAITGFVDGILFYDIRSRVNEEKEKVQERILRCSPDPRWESGNRTGRLPEEIVLTVDDPFAAFKRAWDDGGADRQAKKNAPKTKPEKETKS